MEDNTTKRFLLTRQEAEQMPNCDKEGLVKAERSLRPLLKEILPFIPDAHILHEIFLYDGKTWDLRISEIHFEQYGLDFTISKYKTNYLIYPQYNLPYIDCYAKSHAAESFPTPCRIGVLSKRKIEDWIVYWVQVHNMLKAENNRNREEVEGFRERIMKEKDVKWQGENAGRIDRNGISFYFEIRPTTVYFKMDISYHVSKSLENFIALSDNRYRPQKEK